MLSDPEFDEVVDDVMSDIFDALDENADFHALTEEETKKAIVVIARELLKEYKVN